MTQQTVLTLSEVSRCLISFMIEEEQQLLILLTADGTVNRMGSGLSPNQEKALYIDSLSESLFVQFMEKVPDIFQYQGVYEDRYQQGVQCDLTLLFSNLPQTKFVGFKFIYGAESQTPPPEIIALVEIAIKLTNPAYDQFKRTIST